MVVFRGKNHKSPWPLLPKQLHTINFGLFHSWYHIQRIVSLVGWLTRTLGQSNCIIVVSSLNRTFSHCSLVQLTYFLAKLYRLFIWNAINNGFLTGFQTGRLKSSFRHRRIVLMLMSEHRGGRLCFTLADEINGFFLTKIWILWSVMGVVTLGRPDLFLELRDPVSSARFFVREITDCETPSFFATSVCEMPSLIKARAMPLFFGDNSHAFPIFNRIILCIFAGKEQCMNHGIIRF